MGYAVDFLGTNMTLGAPQGSENVEPMRTFTNGHCSVSCWELNPEELAEVNRTGRIFISVLSGRTQPPIFVSSETVMRGFLVDYGGTWRVDPLKPVPPATTGLETAIEVALRHGWIDGGHHKMWVIDQMLRALLGPQYCETISQIEGWDEGIAP